MKTLCAVLVSLMLLVPPTLRQSHADVVLPSVFGDHMVLQRDVSLPVWGSAEAGERVVVRLGEDQRTTTADVTGHWRRPMASRMWFAAGRYTAQWKSTMTASHCTSIMSKAA